MIGEFLKQCLNESLIMINTWKTFARKPSAASMLMLSQEFCPPPLLSAAAFSFSPFSLPLSPFRSLAGVGVLAVGSRLTV